MPSPNAISFLSHLCPLLRARSYLGHPGLHPRRDLISLTSLLTSGRDLISVTLAFTQGEILSRSPWSSHQGEILSRSPWPSPKARSYLGHLGLLARARSYLAHQGLPPVQDLISVTLPFPPGQNFLW